MSPKLFNIGAKAIIVQDGKVLLLKKETQDRTFWDAPGGRLGDGESVDEALRREVSEELPSATNIVIKGLLSAYVLDRDISPDTGLMLLFHSVDASFSGELKISDEHTEYRWLPIDEAKLVASEGIIAALDKIEHDQ